MPSVLVGSSYYCYYTTVQPRSYSHSSLACIVKALRVGKFWQRSCRLNLKLFLRIIWVDILVHSHISEVWMHIFTFLWMLGLMSVSKKYLLMTVLQKMHKHFRDWRRCLPNFMYYTSIQSRIFGPKKSTLLNVPFDFVEHQSFSNSLMCACLQIHPWRFRLLQKLYTCWWNQLNFLDHFLSVFTEIVRYPRSLGTIGSKL